MQIVLATNNKGKIREIKKMLPDDIEVLSLKDVNFNDEIVEDGNTFFENALKKAYTVCKKTNMITISDDSGLCVDALGGKPGIYSARYSNTGNDLENTKKVLREMKGKKDRKAHFMCSIVVYFPNDTYKSYEGKMEGLIIDELKGENGFGYDPIFYLPEYKMTSAEISMEEKNKISHRAIAIRKMVLDLKNM